jgi:hypothetical protein
MGRISSRIFVSCLLLAASSCTSPIFSEFDLTYDEARAQTWQGETPPYEVEIAQELVDETFKRTVRCVTNRQSEAFAYVLGIREDGRVVRVYTDSSNTLARCFARALRGLKLPPPPQAPYFIWRDRALDSG